MPTNVVDLSAVSAILRDEPWHLHFWEVTALEFAEQIKDPRSALKKLGIEIPDGCSVVCEVVNMDWISRHTDGLSRDNGTIICNVGGGNVAVAAYRITSYGHLKGDVGKFQKTLLHKSDEAKVPGT